MTPHADTAADIADRAYAQAAGSLECYADSDGLAGGVTTLDEYRCAYETVRSELLDDYPDLGGPTIGDLLGDAAHTVWPAVVDLL